MKSWLFLSLFILCLFLTSCNQIGSPSAVPIGEVVSNPRNYEGQTITIEGTVTDAISLLVIKAFVLSDKTGQIYVITERILPRKGGHVRIKGSVEESFPLGSQTMTVFKEMPANQ